VEAVAPSRRRSEEPIRRAEAARCTWSGLDGLRPEIRAAIARRACPNIELDDVVQEALLRAARYRHSLIDPERLRAWVIRIAFNVLRDQMRRDLRLPRVEKADEVLELLEGREAIPGETGEEDALEAEGTILDRELVLRQLDRAFQELPRADRRVLDAFYAQGDPTSSHACVRESAPDLSKVQVFRARARLARALRKRLALGLRADAAARPPGSRKKRRSAPCAPVRPPHVQSGALGAAGNEP